MFLFPYCKTAHDFSLENVPYFSNISQTDAFLNESISNQCYMALKKLFGFHIQKLFHIMGCMIVPTQHSVEIFRFSNQSDSKSVKALNSKKGKYFNTDCHKNLISAIILNKIKTNIWRQIQNTLFHQKIMAVSDKIFPLLRI